MYDHFYFILLSLILQVSGNISAVCADPGDSLEIILDFQLVTPNLASSGYVLDDQFDEIREYGFSHVISLLPGDADHEASIVRSLNMTFTHIPVDFGKPALDDLEAYIKDMKKHRDEKVLVHCDANMRASAFLFIYRVTQLGADKRIAKAAMDEIWYPTGEWHRFIREGLSHYGFDPEYRYEPAFIELIREEGVEAAEEQLAWMQSLSDALPFTAADILRLIDEYAGKNNTSQAIQLCRLSTRAFPDSWESFERLGGFLFDAGDEAGAREAYLKVIELNPGHIRAKRMLGRLGEDEYSVFWKGTEPDPEMMRQLAGSYYLGYDQLKFFIRRGRFYVRPSFSRKRLRLYAESPRRYFVHEKNWTFEFPGETPGRVKFITSMTTFTGTKTR